MGRTRTHKYDNAIIEFFQMGYTPAKVFREVNKQQILLKQPYAVCRTTVWQMYKKWNSEGRQGEVVIDKVEHMPDGGIMMSWRPKKQP